MNMLTTVFPVCHGYNAMKLVPLALLGLALLLPVPDAHGQGIWTSLATLEVDENASATFTVKLSARPTANVTVTPVFNTSPRQNDLFQVDMDTGTAGVQSTLTFTPSTWNTAKTARVTAFDDGEAFGHRRDCTPSFRDTSNSKTHTYNYRNDSLRLSASGAGEYATVSQSIPIRLFEASKPSIIVSQPSVKIVEGSSATVGVSLSHWHLPSYVDRTVRVSHLSPTALPERKEEEYLGCGRSGLTCQTDDITFTSSNYRTPQPFTITAGTDADSNDETETVTLQTFSGHWYLLYCNHVWSPENDATIQVTIVDDDASASALVVTPASLAVAPGGTGEFTVALSKAVTGSDTVTVTVASADTTKATVDTSKTDTGLQSTLSFTASTWSTPQTVQVSATTAAAESSTAVNLSASGGTYGSATGSVTVRSYAGTGGKPSFAANAHVADQWWKKDNAVNLTLPIATGGDGTLTYHISPKLPPGISLDTSGSAPKLVGTPTRASTQYFTAYRNHTFTVQDSDTDTRPQDADTLEFRIIVTESPDFVTNLTTDVHIKHVLAGSDEACLTLSGTPADGVKVTTAACNGSDAKQKWRVQLRNSGPRKNFNRIISRANGGFNYCLDNDSSSKTDDGSKIWSCIDNSGDGVQNQSWRLDPYRGKYALTTVDDAANRGTVQLYAARSVGSSTGTVGHRAVAHIEPPAIRQRWVIVASTKVPVLSGLKLARSSAQSEQSGPPPAERLAGLVGEKLILRNVTPGATGCLDVSGAGARNGQNVQTWECNGTAAQEWRLEQRSAGAHQGRYRLVSGVGDGASYCLDNRGDFRDSGRMGIWSCVSDTHGAAANQTVDLSLSNDNWVLTFARNGGAGYMLWAERSANSARGNVGQHGGTVSSAAEWQISAVAPPPPLTFSVSDAQNEESEGQMSFRVSVNRAVVAGDGTVSVDYATEDGSAVAGADYTATSATLTFAVGDEDKRVDVPVLDDLHDEELETFKLKLSNPVGGTIDDAEGVAYVINSDPLPKAWLARFGRTVAEQVLDGVTGRLAAPRPPGAKVSVAGYPLGLAGAGVAERHAHTETLAEAPPGFGQAGDDRMGLYAGGMTERQALLGTSFTLTGESDDRGGVLAFWGRMAYGSFAGQDGALTLDGEVTTGLLGADYARAGWLAGLMLSHSTGNGSHGDSSLTAATAYGSLTAAARLQLWGAAGVGTGGLTLSPPPISANLFTELPYRSHKKVVFLTFLCVSRLSVTKFHAINPTIPLLGPPIRPFFGRWRNKLALMPPPPPATSLAEKLETDIAWRMAAVGARGALLQPGAAGGLALALVSDALWTRTSSDRTKGLAAATAEVTRLRLGLEGSRTLRLGGGSLTPRLEMGLRQDGGDAETGLGTEVGGGLMWSAPGLGISLDLAGRTLIAHEASSLEDQGLSVGLRFDPRPETNRGPSLSLRQNWGGSPSGGVAALFAPGAPVHHAVAAVGGYLSAEAAWGLPALGGRFTGSPYVVYGLSGGGRDYSLGWRLAPSRPSGPDLSLGAWAMLRERVGAAPDHAAGLNGSVRW